ncbi:ASB2, partial [Symbiodinium natans]
GAATLTPPRPQDFADYETFKTAARKFDDELQSQTLLRFKHLLSVDPSRAKQFISTHTKKASQFHIALTNEDTGQLLSTSAALSAVSDDLVGRAENNFPQQSEAQQFLDLAVKTIRQTQLTSSHWRIRPISIATEMAAVQDGLWLSRTQHFLEKYSTSQQIGGKFDTMSVILAVILHVQLRQQQDLTTFLLFADLKQAYDTANQAAILTTCYLAGVVQTEWNLLFDFFLMDSAIVTLGNAVSSALTFRAGIPQGRKFAVHAFTAFMRLLQAVLVSACNPAATVLPEFAADAISGLWEHLTPLPLAPLPAETNALSATMAAQHLGFAWTHGASLSEMRRIAIHLLSRLPEPERVRCMELLGSQHLGPLLFIDDVVASFASALEVEYAVTSGLPQFARMVKACFNMGPSKTAVMPCFGAVVPALPDIICELFVLLSHAGFSPAVIAHAVVERIEPVILYGAEILPLIPESYRQLNALQSDWARAILADQGGKTVHGIRGSLAVAQMGWRDRLGTKALVKAVMFLAKVELLPRDCPVVRMLHLAQGLHDGTWWQATKDALESHDMWCPSLVEAGVAPLSLLEQARQNSTLRREILRRYKKMIVLPQAMRRDEAEFQESASKMLPGFHLTLRQLFPDRACVSWESVTPDADAADWDCMRVWAFIRLSGLWPLQLLDYGANSETLEVCPLCGEVEIDVAHCLYVCEGTRDLFHLTGASALASRQIEAPMFFSILFQANGSVNENLVCARYVSQAVGNSASTSLVCQLTFHVRGHLGTDVSWDGWDITVGSTRTRQQRHVGNRARLQWWPSCGIAVQGSQHDRVAPPRLEAAARACNGGHGGSRLDPPFWQSLWWQVEEALAWFTALCVWALRRAGRSVAGKRYRTVRTDVQTFNTRYSLLSYAMMASDEKKSASFRRALRRSAKRLQGAGERMVVLEIGCGAYAPFARLCMEEGADQVLAIEGNTWAAARAQRLLGESVKVFAGLSQELAEEQLGAQANVVVMETIGDWAANEYMVSSFLDARGRLCEPEAQWIPGQVRTRFVPVTIPPWGQEGAVPPGMWLLGSDQRYERLALSGAETLEAYDFNEWKDEMLKQQRECVFEIQSSADLQGFLLWVEVFPDGEEDCPLSALRDVDISWSPLLLALPETQRLERGDQLHCLVEVVPAAPDGPELRIELPWAEGRTLKFEWTLAKGARWILPEGREISFEEQPEDVLSPEQEFLWELLGPP